MQLLTQEKASRQQAQHRLEIEVARLKEGISKNRVCPSHSSMHCGNTSSAAQFPLGLRHAEAAPTCLASMQHSMHTLLGKWQWQSLPMY